MLHELQQTTSAVNQTLEHNSCGANQKPPNAFFFVVHEIGHVPPRDGL